MWDCCATRWKSPSMNAAIPGAGMAGSMASFTLPDDEIALLIAVITLDVEYELTSSWMGMSYEGTLEGMIVRACEKKG